MRTSLWVIPQTRGRLKKSPGSGDGRPAVLDMTGAWGWILPSWGIGGGNPISAAVACSCCSTGAEIHHSQCAHAPIPPRVPGTCLPLGGCGASFAQRNAQHAIALGDLGERANHWHLARVLAYNAGQAVGAECSDGLAVGRWPSAGESTSPRAFRLLFVVSLRFCFSPA